MSMTLEDLLRQNFLSFARKALRELEGVKLGREPYLGYLAFELERLADRDTRRLVINLPPGHLKTSLGSVCFAAWLLAHDPSLKIIVVSHAEHLSKSIARKIRSILQSAWFKKLFSTQIKKGHAEVTDFGTTSGGGVFVTSFGARFTGHRADWIIVDDPHDISDQVEQIEATIDSFNTELLSQLNDRKNGPVLVIAHRVNERDLSASLRQRKKWTHVVLPLIASTDKTYQTPTGRWLRRAGELLRPGSLDVDDLEELRQNSVNPDFGMLYQQDINSVGLPAITGSCFPIFDPVTVSGPIVLSVDPGMSHRQRSAYSVIQVWCVASGAYFLLDQFREQVDFVGLRDAVRLYRKRFRPVAILIERAANGHALISELARKYRELLPIDVPRRSKSARFRVHADTIIAQRIRLPENAPWRTGFVQEFCEFPKGMFTDQVDAATQFLDHAGKFADLAPTPRAGIAVAVYGRGYTAAITPSSGGERGRFAGVDGYGRPITNRQATGPVQDDYRGQRTRVR